MSPGFTPAAVSAKRSELSLELINHWAADEPGGFEGFSDDCHQFVFKLHMRRDKV
jgi:hypothetical protein